MQNEEVKKRCYVEVIAHFDEEGRITPLQIIMENGKRFAVDRVIERRYAPSMKCGGFGYRYTVMISGKPHFLWKDDHAFYVELNETNRYTSI